MLCYDVLYVERDEICMYLNAAYKVLEPCSHTKTSVEVATHSSYVQFFKKRGIGLYGD